MKSNVKYYKLFFGRRKRATPKWFIAKCPELYFISQGTTRNEAKKNLLEVIQIQFEEMDDIGTLNEYLMNS